MWRCTIESNFRNYEGRKGRDLEGDWVIINFSYLLGGHLFEFGYLIKEIQYTIAYCLSSASQKAQPRVHFPSSLSGLRTVYGFKFGLLTLPRTSTPAKLIVRSDNILFHLLLITLCMNVQWFQVLKDDEQRADYDYMLDNPG